MATLFVNAEHLAAVREAVRAKYPTVRVIQSSGERYGYRLVARDWTSAATCEDVARIARETVERSAA